MNIPTDYATNGAHEDYRCDNCGMPGVKLWREYQTIASATDLFCAACAMADQKKPGTVDAEGYRHDDGMRTDQIGWLIPAVPTPEGTTFWGYTSVPDAGVRWWRALPNQNARFLHAVMQGEIRPGEVAPRPR